MTTLAQITMNAGDGIPGSTIKWNIRKNRKHFDRIIVIDGDLTDKAVEFYKKYDIDYVDSPWRDSYVDQYRAVASKLEDNEWCLYLDDDECPSPDLLQFFKSEEYKSYKVKLNMIVLPCVLHITGDGNKFYPAEPLPRREYSGQWVKKILFKKESSLDFSYGGSHIVPTHKINEKSIYIPFPYYHMKTLESFVFNDVWQAFLSPEGQHYDPASASMFKVLTRAYKSTKEFKKATQEGSWSPALVNFALKNIYKYNNPISRLGWTYFILYGHKTPNGESVPTWDHVKQYVLSKECMQLLDKNIEMNNCIELDKS